MASNPNSSPKVAVLSKATVNAAVSLGLSHDELAQCLGISDSSVSQLVASKRLIDPHDQEDGPALKLVQIFRALDALVGGDASARIAWMNTYNKTIGDLPKHAIQTRLGLEHTLGYLNGLVTRTSGGQAIRLQ